LAIRPLLTNLTKDRLIKTCDGSERFSSGSTILPSGGVYAVVLSDRIFTFILFFHLLGKPLGDLAHNWRAMPS
jgi:hypothetical protein